MTTMYCISESEQQRDEQDKIMYDIIVRDPVTGEWHFPFGPGTERYILGDKHPLVDRWVWAVQPEMIEAAQIHSSIADIISVQYTEEEVKNIGFYPDMPMGAK